MPERSFAVLDKAAPHRTSDTGWSTTCPTTATKMRRRTVPHPKPS